jgi:hypothetical protein
MNRYTVVWSPSARRRLAELWLDNPAVRQEIADAADEVDRALAHEPTSVGISTSGRARLVVRPPISVLFLVLDDDRQVRVIYVKLWDESL